MNCVVLVTGASAGMGQDFALRLINEGCTVYGAARGKDEKDRGRGGLRCVATASI